MIHFHIAFFILHLELRTTFLPEYFNAESGNPNNKEMTSPGMAQIWELTALQSSSPETTDLNA